MKRRHWMEALHAVPLSLLGMTATAVAAALAVAIYRRELPEPGELLLVLVIGTLGMAIHSAIVLALVYVPAAVVLRTVAGREGRRWVRLSCLALWPVAFGAFVQSARLIVPNNPRLRPSLWDDLAYILQHLEVTAPVLLALLVGSLIFGKIQASRWSA